MIKRSHIVAFYWTRAVPWRGHYHLPKAAIAASRVSRTIRYQRLLAKAFARRTGREILEEITWLDPEDRAWKHSQHIADALGHTLERCRRNGGDAILVYVDFSRVGRRPHPALQLIIKAEKIMSYPLDPVTVRMRGVRFSPAEHFRSWARRKEQHEKALKTDLIPTFWSAYDSVKSSDRSDRVVAELLNARHVLPARKQVWNAEMVRTMRRRHPRSKTHN